MKKQAELSRALKIENERPRFKFEMTDSINSGEDRLYQKCIEEKELKNQLSSYDLMRLENISSNNIYTLNIILNYTLNGSKKTNVIMD